MCTAHLSDQPVQTFKLLSQSHIGTVSSCVHIVYNLMSYLTPFFCLAAGYCHNSYGDVENTAPRCRTNW